MENIAKSDTLPSVRRLLRYSQAFLFIVPGLWGFGYSCAVLHYGPALPLAADIIFVYSMFFALIVTYVIQRHLRRKKQIHVRPHEKSGQELFRSISIIYWLVMVTAITLLEVFVPDDLRSIGFVFLITIPIQINFYRELRLWEDAAIIIAFICGGAALLIFGRTALGWSLMLVSVMAIAIGLSLHLRWRRWVQALPKNNGEPETGTTLR